MTSIPVPKTTLNRKEIDRAIDSFPFGTGWTTIRCADLIRPKSPARGLDWGTIGPLLRNTAGLYAFLFPRSQFASVLTVQLDGPRKNGKTQQIDFNVRIADLPPVGQGLFVAYVGRSANLLQRLQWHFHATQNTTTAQVRKALTKCGHSRHCEGAIEFMTNHASIVFRCMPGVEHIASRDIIEVALWAKYHSPFNIKAER